MPEQENVSSLHEEQHHIAWQPEFSYSLYQRRPFPKRILHARTYKYTHRPVFPATPSFLSVLLTLYDHQVVQAWWPTIPEDHIKTKDLCGEREAGRKRPLKHTHTYAINNTTTYSQWLLLCCPLFHYSTACTIQLHLKICSCFQLS